MYYKSFLEHGKDFVRSLRAKEKVKMEQITDLSYNKMLTKIK